ncbi:MAG: CbtB-domain containing protein [Alphaproteobacteria bacterium]
MSDHTVARTNELSSAVGAGSRAAAAVIAALLGTFIVLGVGFAHLETVHNAAHDTRHSFAFPCH